MPREDPPVGTRGRPLRDLFFSGCVGKSQSPNTAGVVEKALRVVDEVKKEEGVAGAFERAEMALGIIEGR